MAFPSKRKTGSAGVCALIDDISIDGYARHVLARLDELRIDRVVFGGVSMGGHVTCTALRQENAEAFNAAVSHFLGTIR